MLSAPKAAPRGNGSRWTRAATMAAILVLTNAIVITTVGLSLARSRSLLEERARAATLSVARTIELDLEGILAQADLAVRWASEARGRDLEALQARQGAAVPFLGTLRTADAQGRIRPGPGGGPAPSVAGLDLFKALRDGPGAACVTTGLLPDPVTGEPGVLLGRRLAKADGTFDGIIFARIDEARLSRALGMVDLGPHGLVVLRGLDLKIIERHPPLPGLKAPPRDLAAHLEAGETSGLFLNQHPVDGVQRLIAFRVLPGHAVVVVAGSAVRDYLAAWHREVLQSFVLAFVFLVLSVLATLRLQKSWKRDAEADLAVATLAARAHSDALRAAFYEIAQATLEAPSLEDLYARIHTALGALLPARNFYVALLDERTGLVSFPYFVDERDPRPEPRPVTNSLTDRVLQSGRPLLLTPENAFRMASEEGVEVRGTFSVDWLGVPLMERDRTFGVLAVQSYSSELRYSPEDVELLRLASSQVAASIRRKQAEEALRASEDRFSKAFHAIPDSVSVNSLVDRRYVVVNEAFTRITGWSSAEALGSTPLPDSLNLWGDLRDRARIVEGLERRGSVDSLEITIRRKDGTLLTGLMSATLIDLAGEPCALAITRDITAQKAQARQLERMTRLYDALSQVSQAVVLASGEEEMLERICRVLVEDGKFSLAWLGWDDPATRRVRVGTRYGDRTHYLEDTEVRTDDTALGQGPTGLAIRERRTIIVNDFMTFMKDSPWREAAARAGFAASVALPLRRGGVVCGALMVYATEKGFFGELEVALLEEVAATLSFALDHLDGERSRMEAEATLRREHDRAETYLRVARVVLVAVDADLRVTMLNQEGYDLLGRPEGSLQGRDWLEASAPPEDVERTRAFLLGLLRGDLPQGEAPEAWLVRGDGERRRLTWSNTVLRGEDGRPTGILSCGLDITERQRAEQEREALHAQLAQAQKLESLGSLAGGVAHDMNNVLAAILALASSQEEIQVPGTPVHRAFDRIVQAAVRGGKMVKSLLSFARKNPTELRDVDLGGLLLEQAQLLEHTTLARVRLELDLEPRLRVIRGDASSLSHMFLNLCVNAVDAMPEGGTLALSTRNLAPDRVEVDIVDTGVGMAPDVLNKALDPFFTTKPEGRGTGLGLSMAYSTVKAHGGTLELLSEPGAGTRVRLRFPAVEPGPEGPAPDPGRPEPRQPGKLDVLLVDDDDLVRESECLALETLGHKVLQASSGEEGLAVLEEGFDPDLVILDINMPGLGGPGTLDLLRKWRPGTPVVMATGRVDQAALDLVKAHPGVTLLAKPFDLKDLRAHLGTIAW